MASIEERDPIAALDVNAVENELVAPWKCAHPRTMLHEELDRLGRANIGIVLKIETRAASRTCLASCSEACAGRRSR